MARYKKGDKLIKQKPMTKEELKKWQEEYTKFWSNARIKEIEK